MSNCPRCSGALADAQVDTFTVHLCEACQGVFAAHRDMIEILDRSWRSIPAQAAEETQFLRPEKPEADTLRCPRCLKPMEKYGYMGLAAITIDRCDGCTALWLDASELQNMVLALAKSNYRSEARRRREFGDFDPMQASATAPTGSFASVINEPREGDSSLAITVADTAVGILMALMRCR